MKADAGTDPLVAAVDQGTSSTRFLVSDRRYSNSSVYMFCFYGGYDMNTRIWVKYIVWMFVMYARCPYAVVYESIWWVRTKVHTLTLNCYLPVTLYVLNVKPLRTHIHGATRRPTDPLSQWVRSVDYFPNDETRRNIFIVVKSKISRSASGGESGSAVWSVVI